MPLMAHSCYELRGREGRRCVCLCVCVSVLDTISGLGSKGGLAIHITQTRFIQTKLKLSCLLIMWKTWSFYGSLTTGQDRCVCVWERESSVQCMIAQLLKCQKRIANTLIVHEHIRLATRIEYLHVPNPDIFLRLWPTCSIYTRVDLVLTFLMQTVYIHRHTAGQKSLMSLGDFVNFQ